MTERPNRKAPLDLWRTAAWLLDTIGAIFGVPTTIAARGYTNRKDYALLRTWLSAAEHFLRRLLLLEARAVIVPPASCRQLAAGWKPAVRTPEPIAENSEDWRVSFGCLLDRRRPAGTLACKPADVGASAKSRRDAGAPSIHPTRPLARRYEALLRVFRNPIPYALRLARLITRLPKIIARYLARPFQCKRRSGDPPPLIDIVGRDSWANLEAALNSS